MLCNKAIVAHELLQHIDVWVVDTLLNRCWSAEVDEVGWLVRCLVLLSA